MKHSPLYVARLGFEDSCRKKQEIQNRYYRILLAIPIDWTNQRCALSGLSTVPPDSVWPNPTHEGFHKRLPQSRLSSELTIGPPLLAFSRLLTSLTISLGVLHFKTGVCKSSACGKDRFEGTSKSKTESESSSAKSPIDSNTNPNINNKIQIQIFYFKKKFTSVA